MTDVFGIPYETVFSFCFFTFLSALAAGIARRKYWRKPTITRGSVREAFDHMPVGICFADSSGVVRLSNRRMRSICMKLTGSDLQKTEDLRKIINTEKADVSTSDSALLDLGEGRKVQISFRDLADGKVTYTQITAVDVSDLLKEQEELKRSNRKLQEAISLAEKLYQDLDSLIREEETAAMRMRVHDDFGTSLLLARMSLIADCTLEKIKKNIPFWKRAVEAAGGPAFDKEIRQVSSDEWEGLLAESTALGVKITVIGHLPSDQSRQHIFISAVRECVTNCVRHAKGDEVTLNAGEESLEVTNNGSVPAGEIREGSGLTSLRLMVEKAGGRMRVEAFPRFRLMIQINSCYE